MSGNSGVVLLATVMSITVPPEVNKPVSPAANSSSGAVSMLMVSVRVAGVVRNAATITGQL